ncbi:MAG: protein phosphatase CheZ [Syntrophobacterales bacterium]|nr:protein phosphatase CheZ [Syntrophobacterales bacterium]
MDTEEKLVEKLANYIVSKMEPSIKDIIGKTVQEEVVVALKKALVDSEFYRGLSDDVVEGIGKIYSEIHSAKREISLDQPVLGTLKTLGESQSVLDNVLSITESATLKIMDFIELVQEKIREAKAILEDLEKLEELRKIHEEIDQTLLEMLTILSFQDITGQKIKKLIESLKRVEEIAFELYLSSEAFKKAKDEGFERGYEELREEVRKHVEGLKKRRNTVDQNAVDELLKSLSL